jgi:hypothetical protein
VKLGLDLYHEIITSTLRWEKEPLDINKRWELTMRKISKREIELTHANGTYDNPSRGLLYPDDDSHPCCLFPITEISRVARAQKEHLLLGGTLRVSSR